MSTTSDTSLVEPADVDAPVVTPDAIETELDTARQDPLRTVGTIALYAGISVLALVYWRGFQMEGHNGGDDFALYIDQARSVLHGNIGETLANTRFAVDSSAWHTFSPYGYPWGFPLMLVPVMALTGVVDRQTGIDYAPLKLVVTVTFLVAMFAYFAMLRRRVHPFGSIILPLFFSLNVVYVLHTDNVLSELPFLMSLMLFVVALDRCRERGRFLGAQLAPLVGLGLLACLAFNIRREGLGILLGLALAQVAAVWTRTAADDHDSGDEGVRSAVRRRASNVRRLDWRPLATPWITFFGATVLFQLLLPSDIAPRFVERDPTATAGLHRIRENLEIYKPLLAEQLGLKDFGPAEITAFNSTAWGAVVFWSVLAFAALGVILTAIKFPSRDLPVLGVAVGVAFFVMTAPFQTYRYIMSLVPFLLYFAYQGIAVPLSLIRWRQAAYLLVVADLAVFAFILGGWDDTANARDYRSNWIGPQPGPQMPDTLQMYEAVRTHTRGDDVVVANRARLMTLYTSRRSVQGGAIDFIETGGDYYVMYLEPDGTPGTYTQYPLTDEEAESRGFVEVWRNAGWVLWRNPEPDEQP